jgi:hypothetical protein
MNSPLEHTPAVLLLARSTVPFARSIMSNSFPDTAAMRELSRFAVAFGRPHRLRSSDVDAAVPEVPHRQQKHRRCCRSARRAALPARSGRPGRRTARYRLDRVRGLKKPRAPFEVESVALSSARRILETNSAALCDHEELMAEVELGDDTAVNGSQRPGDADANGSSRARNASAGAPACGGSSRFPRHARSATTHGTIGYRPWSTNVRPTATLQTMRHPKLEIRPRAHWSVERFAAKKGGCGVA